MTDLEILRADLIAARVPRSTRTVVALVVAVAATIVLGIYPRLLFEVAEASARTLGIAGSLNALR